MLAEAHASSDGIEQRSDGKADDLYQEHWQSPGTAGRNGRNAQQQLIEQKEERGGHNRARRLVKDAEHRSDGTRHGSGGRPREAELELLNGSKGVKQVRLSLGAGAADLELRSPIRPMAAQELRLTSMRVDTDLAEHLWPALSVLGGLTSLDLTVRCGRPSSPSFEPPTSLTRLRLRGHLGVGSVAGLTRLVDYSGPVPSAGLERLPALQRLALLAPPARWAPPEPLALLDPRSPPAAEAPLPESLPAGLSSLSCQRWLTPEEVGRWLPGLPHLRALELNLLLPEEDDARALCGCGDLRELRLQCTRPLRWSSVVRLLRHYPRLRKLEADVRLPEPRWSPEVARWPSLVHLGLRCHCRASLSSTYWRGTRS